MKCKNIREMLVRYLDNDLVDESGKMIDEHLAACPECRTVLNGYQVTKNRLAPLKELAESADIRDKTIAGIRLAEQPSRYPKWLRPVAITGLPLILVLVIVFSVLGTGIFAGGAGVLARAIEKTANLQSSHYTKGEYSQFSETAELIKVYYMDCRYNDPDQYRIVVWSNNWGTTSETILRDDTVYVKGILGQQDKSWFTSKRPTYELTEEALDVLEDIESLPDETIDGTDCYHYTGRVDMDKYLVWLRPSFREKYDWLKTIGTDATFEEFCEVREQTLRGKEITYEFWIGKDDSLIRRWKQSYRRVPGVYPQLNIYYSETDFRFEYDGEVIIEPPLDGDGNLQDGWTAYPLEE